MSAAPSDPPRARLVRVARFTGAEVTLRVEDGRTVTAHEGESVLSAALGVPGHRRLHEVDGQPRAGFCLMGACQDCRVWFGEACKLRPNIAARASAALRIRPSHGASAVPRASALTGVRCRGHAVNNSYWMAIMMRSAPRPLLHASLPRRATCPVPPRRLASQSMRPQTAR